MLNNSTFVTSNNERDLSDRLLQTLYTNCPVMRLINKE